MSAVVAPIQTFVDSRDTKKAVLTCIAKGMRSGAMTQVDVAIIAFTAGRIATPQTQTAGLCGRQCNKM